MGAALAINDDVNNVIEELDGESLHPPSDLTSQLSINNFNSSKNQSEGKKILIVED